MNEVIGEETGAFSIRKFTKEDSGKVLELIKWNTPLFFHPSEERDLDDYLLHHAQNFFVVEDEGVIVGAGGFNLGFDGGKTARISWDIIHPDYQGKGFGKQLLQYRINKIKVDQSATKIVVRTTQLVYLFYQKCGFTLEKIKKDFWAVGFDLYEMSLKIG